ncbi:MAG: hypothetical protein J6X58_07625 [Bacteroidales bacterium]|nr:hypothetical protein [Bacteroidales bacterium]
MKKIIFSLLLCAFASSVMAQEQEDVVVRRGKYKPTETDTIHKEKKERIHNDWYNKISISAMFGGYNAKVVDKTAGKTTEHSSYVTNAISYERLKKNGLFFYGPGIQFAELELIDIFDKVALDLYLHGMIDYKMKSDFLGFGKLHPYAGVSIGIRFTNMGGYYYYHEFYQHYGGFEDWFHISVEENFTIRLYNDIRIGFSINIGKYCALNIGYKASLTPNYKLEGYFGTNQEYYLKKKGIGAMHGAEISFRF